MLDKPQKPRIFTDPLELGGSVDFKPRPAGSIRPSSSLEPSSSVAPGNGGNVDSVLFKNLVDMVPLVESLMDKKANSSFRRRASMVYTPAPSQLRKVSDPSSRRTYNSTMKRKETGNNANLESSADDSSIFSSRVVAGNSKKDRVELAMLREQVDDLQKKLLEKDEALKSVENSLNKMNIAYISPDELRHQVEEKDLLVKSTNLQLYDAKIKLADKQAALEKLEWEVRMSNRKAEELQANVVSMEVGVTALMQIFEDLSKTNPAAYPDVNIDSLYHFEQLPHIDDIDEIETEKMEDARTAYVAAVAAAKENPGEDSITAAADARQRLQAFVL